MRVLFWVELSWEHIGGVETFSSQVVRGLQSRGVEFTVLCRGRDTTPQRSTLDGCPIWYLPMAHALMQRDLPAISEILRTLHAIKADFQPDLIHLNSIYSCAFFYLRVASAWGVPTLLTLHQPFDGLMGAGLATQTLAAVDYVAAVSTATLDGARRLVPTIAGRSSLIYNALPDPPVAPLPCPLEPPMLLCVGRLTEQKGFDLVIRALPRILAQAPTARVVIAGHGSDEAALRQLAMAEGVEEQVEFVGPLSHEGVYRLMNRATLVLMPSRYEPFGLVALEAAQMARPVVASRVDGLAEVVSDGETGLLIPPEDPDALAEAVLTLLRDPALAERVGRAAQQRAADRFSFDRFLGEYEALYRRLGGAP